MRLFSAIRNNDSIGLLRQMADRNVSAEIHFQRGGFLYVGRSRFLAVLDDHVVLEKPTFTVPCDGLVAEQLVTVYFQVGGTRYAFQTLVLQPRTLYPLREDTRVGAVTLDFPGEVERNQRRQHYRISVGGRHEIAVYFHDADATEQGGIPIDAERFSGRMIDLSVGGMRALVFNDQRRQFHLGERFFAAFDLPALAGEFRPLVRVCYLKLIRDGEAHQVGVQFMPWEGFSPSDEHYRLNAFIVNEQRRQRQGIV